MDVPHYWTADQVQRLLDALASHNRHQARTAALIMWRTGLRVSEVLELEWRDLDYSGRPATLLVRKSKSRRARTVRMHADLVPLCELAGKQGVEGQGGCAGYADGVAAHCRWNRVGEPRRGIARDWEATRGCPLPAAQCCQALADGREGPTERGFAMAGPCLCAGHPANLLAHRGERLRHGICSVKVSGYTCSAPVADG